MLQLTMDGGAVGSLSDCDGRARDERVGVRIWQLSVAVATGSM
jgi:hypothetical protein